MNSDERGENEAEIERLTRRLAKRPRDAAAWFDLGLTHKLLRNWRASADANERALAIRQDEEDPAWWNLGIAATALRDWDRARRAWRAYGIGPDILPDGSGAIDLDWGPSPVRVVSRDGGTKEVVWCRRLCPARARVESIPYPRSDHRWGDIVLHDGAPNGERVAFAKTYPVFDELERWSPSEIPTLRADVRCASESDAEALIDAFRAALFEAEDWSTSVRTLCVACSQGNPDHHDHGFPEGGQHRIFGIAAPRGLAEITLRAWREKEPASRDIDGVETVF